MGGFVFAGPVWVAVGESGLLLYSRNGWEWERATPPAGKQAELRHVVYGAGKFVATERKPDAGARIFTSTDGQNWVSIAAPDFAPDQLTYGGGRFVAVQGRRLWRSLDGERFDRGANLELATSNALCLELSGGDTEAGFRFVAVGGAQTRTESEGWRAVTSDGLSWDSVEQSITIGPLAYGAGHFVMAQAGRIATSHDGQTWKREITLPDKASWRLFWTGSRFICCGNEAWSSADGREWERAPENHFCRFVWIRDGIGSLWRNEDASTTFIDAKNHRHATTLPIPPPVLHAIAYKPE